MNVFDISRAPLAFVVAVAMSIYDAGATAHDVPLDLGFLNSEGGESWISFSQDGKYVVFGRHDDDCSDHRLFIVQQENGQWSGPSPVLFGGEAWRHQIRAARFTPDGSSILFSTNGGHEENETGGNFDIWKAKFEKGQFAKPARLPYPINTPAQEFHPSVTNLGALYFASDREGGRGRSDLYVARFDVEGWSVTPVAELNTEFSEPDSFIAPDESFIVFARTNGPDGLGGDDLYISRRGDGAWHAPCHLEASVNSVEYEYGPWVDPERTLLYFTSHKSGAADIFSVPFPAK